MSNAGNFFFFQELNSKGLYLNSQKENRCHGCSQFLHKNAKLGSRRRSRAVTAKKDGTKKRARVDLLPVCQSKPIAFLPFSLPSPSSLLKLPRDDGGGGVNTIQNFYFP